MKAYVSLALALGASPTACGDNDAVAGPGGASGADASADGQEGALAPQLVGAWFGAGPDFPDGAFCLIFCANGRLFASDWPCTETDASDFEHYLMYTVSDQTFLGEGPDGVVLSGDFELSGDSGTFRIEASEGDFTVALDRTAADSPLCTSGEPTWQGW